MRAWHQDSERGWEAGGRRYSHLLNPGTGWPIQGLASVTVAAETCLAAGMMSTIAMLKGDEGAAWLEKKTARCVHVDASGNLGGSLIRRGQPAQDSRSGSRGIRRTELRHQTGHARDERRPGNGA